MREEWRMAESLSFCSGNDDSNEERMNDPIDSVSPSLTRAFICERKELKDKRSYLRSCCSETENEKRHHWCATSHIFHSPTFLMISRMTSSLLSTITFLSSDQYSHLPRAIPLDHMFLNLRPRLRSQSQHTRSIVASGFGNSSYFFSSASRGIFTVRDAIPMSKFSSENRRWPAIDRLSEWWFNVSERFSHKNSPLEF